MISIGLVNFDAATAAAEMEADRQRARDQRDPRDRSDEDGLPWWWSPAEIVYQPSGHVTRRMAEGRVMRAVAWCLGVALHPSSPGAGFFRRNGSGRRRTDVGH
jgi:hypothetical protein